MPVAGVMYHHFPAGKTQLAIAAIEASLARIESSFRQPQGSSSGPVQMIQIWLDQAQARLEQTGFECGCPLATIALETTPGDHELRTALANAFGELREMLARMLSHTGMRAIKAQQLSALIVSAYEGALIQARVAESTKPIKNAMEPLLGLVRLEIPRKAASHER